MRRSLFWSNPKIDVSDRKNLPYIVHQTLMFGSLKDIKQLVKKLGKKTVSEIFVKNPINVYSKPAFRFTKNIVLGLKNKKLNEKKYVKAIF